MLEIRDYVVFRDKALFDGGIGRINNIRVDSGGEPLFTILMSNDCDAVFYYARFCEIEKYVYGVN